MRASVLIETEPSSALDADARPTAISDLPIEDGHADVPATGSVLDERYEILGLLGEGGMGHVLAARHVVLGQRLAIKVLRREMTRDAEIVERFRREARAASAIGHVGIVGVRDFGTLASGASYFVMEHVEGRSLADALVQDGPFSVERAVRVVRQMCDALGAAHAAGIVHRDVKPENVLLASFHGRADHVKILDFGIAKLDFASRLSGAHRVLGTPAYMSPEQARGQGLDQRTDVYSLAILLYELLVGDVPFDDPLPLEVLRKQLVAVPPRLTVARPDVPEALADIVARCLEKSPDARPTTMQELSELLAPFGPARSLDGSAAPSVAPRSSASASGASGRASPLSPLAASSLSLPSPVASRPTPVSTAPVASRLGPVAVLGIALTLLGVAALAAAGGLFLRGRAVSAAVAPPSLAPVAAPAVSVAVAPPVTEITPTPVVSAPRAPAAVAPSVVLSRPLPPHRPLRPVTSIAPEPAPEPIARPAPPPEHSAIQVIDPWDDP